MPKITRKQYDNWNAKLSNGFRLDLQRFCVWNEKVAVRTIELPDGMVLKAEIGWHELSKNWCVIGLKPRLTFSLWKHCENSDLWHGCGTGATVELSEQVYTKRNWNELGRFTAGWDDERILAEAKKHMAELKEDKII